MPAALRHFDVPDARRRELLAYLSAREVSPTWVEMKRALHMGTDMLAFLLDDMEKSGQIRRLRGRARAIEVVPFRLQIILTPADCEARAAEKRALWQQDEAA